MQKKIINNLPDFPSSRVIGSIKDIIAKLLLSIPQEKAIPKENKESYCRVLKQIEWGISKLSPHWPEEIESMANNLKQCLIKFESATNQSRNSSFICGGSKGKDIGYEFSKIMGYQHMFTVIAHYQNKDLKRDLVNNVLDLYEKENNPRQQTTKTSLPEIEEKTSKNHQEIHQNCPNCKLYLSLSLQPNGSLAKSLLKTLPNTEWVLGILYQEGKIFPQDTAKAAQFYQKAKTKNNADSIYRLGSLNQRGQYGRPYEYIGMWETAAEMGNLEAITDMGFLYEKGLVDEDIPNKVILQKNSAKAHEYYLKAAKENFPRGLNNLGSFYQLDPTYKNKDKSIDCFNKAVEAGYIKAMFNLALCYSQGFVGVSDPQKAKQLFKRAADLGDHYSKLFYVDILLNGDPSNCTEDELDEAHRFCREMIAEEDDRAEAYYFLGTMYEQGYGTNREPKTALLYYTKASDLNYVHGQIKLADCYRNGFGIEQDHKKAIRLYELASKTKPEALVSIGEIFQSDSDMINRNYQTAFKYYFQACNHNVVKAFQKLGKCYEQGRGCKRDLQKAREYFSKFEKLNCSQSYLSKTNLMQSQSSVGQSSQVYPRRKI